LNKKISLYKFTNLYKNKIKDKKKETAPAILFNKFKNFKISKNEKEELKNINTSENSGSSFFVIKDKHGAGSLDPKMEKKINLISNLITEFRQ
jgi:hypothetical protein